MTFAEIETYLREAPINYEARLRSKDAATDLAKLKAQAVGRGDQVEAKKLWCFEQALTIQDTFIETFVQLRRGEFYDAWCLLEQAELKAHWLRQHLDDESFRRFHLAFIQEYIGHLQALYPYKLFFSPEFIEEEKRCTICDAIVSIRTPCGHRVGEVYNGEMCFRKVTKAKAAGISIVEQPVQKYSVVFPAGDGKERRDPYDYSLIRFVTERVPTPFARWFMMKATRRHPHSRYAFVGRNEKCPCDSGEKYKRCCLGNADGVLRPHYVLRLAGETSGSDTLIEYSR